MEKMVTFTFNSGVTVKGLKIKDVVHPMEFNSEISCEKHLYKLFMEGINCVMIKSFSNPKKYYIQIL